MRLRFRLRCVREIALVLLLPLSVSAQAREAADYPDSEKGLRAFLGDLMREVKKGDEARFAAIAGDVALPDYQTWFIAVFGNSFGQEMALAYADLRNQIQNTLYAGMQKLNQDGFRGPQVRRQVSPCLSGTSDKVFRILASRKTDVPFYSVTFQRGEISRSAGFFVYVDDAFRWLGNIRFNPANDVAGLPTAPPQPASPALQSKALVKSVAPVYPPEARKSGIQGTVRLSAIIAKDGTLKELSYVSGPCSLADAAMTAVRQWRYKPTAMNDELVEVATTIDVVFTLSR